jgi:hypothetical protein
MCSTHARNTCVCMYPCTKLPNVEIGSVFIWGEFQTAVAWHIFGAQLPKTHLHCPPLPGAPLQVRQQAADRYQAEMQAEAAVAQAAGSWRSSQRAGLQAPPNLMPPGYDPAGTAPLQPQRMPPAAGAAGAGPVPQAPAQRAFNVGQAMAQMLLSMPMPMPRWSGRGSGGGRGGARRGLPANLMQMRDAVLGMQRAGLPPHLLFSDRDFTAGTLRLGSLIPCLPPCVHECYSS